MSTNKANKFFNFSFKKIQKSEPSKPPFSKSRNVPTSVAWTGINFSMKTSNRPTFQKISENKKTTKIL